MEKAAIDTLEKVKEAITKCANESGWANLADLGPQLKELNVHYKKLSKFLKAFDEILEMKLDESIQPPVMYARLKD